MKIFSKKLINLQNLNNLILILLILSFFRYHKLEISFSFFGNYNPIKFFGQIAFFLLLFLTTFYLFILNKKVIIYLLIIFLGWSTLSFLLNYNRIDYDYIKKSFQIFYCFYLFFVFSTIRLKLNFKFLEYISLSIILSTILFLIFYQKDIIQFHIKLLLFFLFVAISILFFLIQKNRLYQILSILLLLYFFLKLSFFEYNYIFKFNYFDDTIGLFTRQNSFSWMVMCLFSLKLFLDFREKKFNKSIYLLIISFSVNFLSVYILLSQLILIFLFLINFYFKNFLKPLLILFFITIFLYLYMIIFKTDFYIYLINTFFNFFGDSNAYGIINGKDKNNYFLYELSTLSQKKHGTLMDIYSGLIYRAVIAKLYLVNLFNGIHLDISYQMEIEHYYLSLENEIIIPNDMTKFKYYSSFLEKCSQLSLRGSNCFNQTGLFDGYVVNTIDKYFSIHDISEDPGFKDLTIYKQQFNSSHNQYFDLLNNFGYIGFLIIAIGFYAFLKEIFSEKNSLFICIYLLNLLIILNFDNYLFYNFFNVSYFIWLNIGLIYNKNLIIK